MPEAAPPNRTIVERKSDLELVVTRRFDAPREAVFAAWTTPALFMRWWAPKSMGVPLRSCAMDVRNGGTYRLEFGHDAAQSFAFFGNYVEVIPGARLVWTNDEGADGALTTVSFDAAAGQTRLVFHELYPSKAALDAAIDGMEAGIGEQFDQLDELLGDADRG